MIVALAALGLTFLFRDEDHDKVLIMHYTAMAAVTYTSMDHTPDLTNAVDISGFANTSIVIVTFVVLGSVFLLPRMFSPTQKPAQSEA